MHSFLIKNIQGEKHVKIIRMNGGLGNQLFQYIFLRYIEEMTGDICYIDDRVFVVDQPQHNGYEISKIFSLNPNRLSKYFDKDVWDYIMKLTYYDKTKNIVDLLNEFGLEILPFTESFLYEEHTGYEGSCYRIEVNSFSSDVLRVKGNIYYYGYWINANWFSIIKHKILEELTFPSLIDEGNKELLKMIQSSASVGVHIRRGDFVTLGWDLPKDWYVETLSFFREKMKSPVFIIFSDDLAWVRGNFKEIGFKVTDQVVVSEKNMNGNNYIDMYLMTQCKHLIIANSSFSYLAALLNQNMDKCVLNPVSFREVI